jgi:hypothetical protein
LELYRCGRRLTPKDKLGILIHRNASIECDFLCVDVWQWQGTRYIGTSDAVEYYRAVGWLSSRCYTKEVFAGDIASCKM